MSTKPFDRAAFGSQSARFTLNGVHPNLLQTGRMPYDSKITAPAGAHLGPGSYEQLKYCEFSEANVNKKADGPNWERALLTEKLAKMPNLLYQETFKKKLEDKRRVGPGYYFQNGHAQSAKPTSTRGMLDQLSDRFAYIKPNDNPGPSEYGIPDEMLEEKRKNKPGTVPSFERSKESRSLPMVGSEVPPGTYKHKYSIDELLKKKVSSRGPYDLFSEERSGPPKSGHFIEDSNPILGPGSYEVRTFVDDLSDYAHAKRGKFGKIEQRPAISGERISINYTSLHPRNPSWPGPGYYEPGEMSKVNANLPPFLTSSIRDDKRNTKAFNHNYNKCGVGRYDITRPDASIHINSHKSIFLSKSAQITKETDKRYMAERIRPVNLDYDEKMRLHLTGNVRPEVEAKA